MVLGRQQITTETAVTHSSFLGNHIKKKNEKKTRSYLIGQSTGVFTLGGVMGRHVCQMSASNLPAPAPTTSSSAAVEFYTPSLSTPPTTVPWTPFPLLHCFICAFPFLPLSTYPPFKKGENG